MDEGTERRDFNRDMHQLPADRRDLIFRVRRQIAEGTYETRAKLRIAVDRLFEHVCRSNP